MTDFSRRRRDGVRPLSRCLRARDLARESNPVDRIILEQALDVFRLAFNQLGGAIEPTRLRALMASIFVLGKGRRCSSDEARALIMAPVAGSRARSWREQRRDAAQKTRVKAESRCRQDDPRYTSGPRSRIAHKTKSRRMTSSRTWKDGKIPRHPGHPDLDEILVGAMGSRRPDSPAAEVDNSVLISKPLRLG